MENKTQRDRHGFYSWFGVLREMKWLGLPHAPSRRHEILGLWAGSQTGNRKFWGCVSCFKRKRGNAWALCHASQGKQETTGVCFVRQTGKKECLNFPGEYQRKRTNSIKGCSFWDLLSCILMDTQKPLRENVCLPHQGISYSPKMVAVRSP